MLSIAFSLVYIASNGHSGSGVLALTGGSSSGGGASIQRKGHGAKPQGNRHSRPGRLLRQEEPMSLHGLWDWLEDSDKDSGTGRTADSGVADSGAVRVAQTARNAEASGASNQHVALDANGVLHLTKQEAAWADLKRGANRSTYRSGQGGIAWRLIARDGRKIVEGGAFDGPAELGRRLAEVEQRCPRVLEKRWALIDSAADTAGGHHWVLQGPVDDKNHLLHVSSVIRAKENRHSILRFSPRKLCGPSVLLQTGLPSERGSDPNDTDSAHHHMQHISFDELELAQNDNPNVVDSWLFAGDKLKSETASNCPSNQRIENITLISSRIEVAAGINVYMTVSVTPVLESVTPTYHTFACDWHVASTGSATLHPDLILPYRRSDDTQLAWCELLTESTESAFVQMAEKHGHKAVTNIHQRLGWLGGYRDFHPNPDFVELEDRAAEQAKALNHLKLTCPIQSVSQLPSTWSPATTMQSCFAATTVEDQGECGACWAFSVATSLAMRMCMEFPESMGIGTASGRKHLSKQQLMSCNTERSGCRGGTMSSGMWEARKGVGLEDDYPYDVNLHEWPWSRTGKKCDWGNVKKPFIVVDSINFNYLSEAEIRKELYCNGPLTAGFIVKFNFINFYEGPFATHVYTAVDALGETDVGPHAVTLIAWGLKVHDDGSDNTLYWMLQNSWGQQWGDGGNFRMQRGINLCGIEEMLVLSGVVQETTGNWKYTAWSDCDQYHTAKKTRHIECVGEDMQTLQDDSTCPGGVLHQNWPDKDSFPSSSADNEQEKQALKDCVDTEELCTRTHACNGRGDAWMDYQFHCQCTCDPFFISTDTDGNFCNQCSADASGYPNCRKSCKASERCNDLGIASGNEWLNEFDVLVHNCECDCNTGFMGDSCEQCVILEDTWPHCQSVQRVHHGVSGGTWTTTTTLPPCVIWQGPIELNPPPVGSNPYVVIRCDVRAPNCEPWREKCITGSYANFCTWNGTMCVDKDTSANLVEDIRFFLTDHSYALPPEADKNRSSGIIMLGSKSLGVTPSQLGFESLRMRLLAPSEV